MPAGYTHYVFGEQVLDQLDESIKKRIMPYIDLYHIGIHGPDILFYYDVYKKNPVKSLGFGMHQLPANSFFKHAKELIKQDATDAALAYTIGFITHFTLDSSLHPEIGVLENTLSMTHSLLESELDRELLVRVGKDPLTANLTTHIHPDYTNAQVIAPFFDLKAEEVDKALHDLLFILKWLVAPTKLKRNFVLSVMKLGGMYEEYKGLLINYEKDEHAANDINHLIEMKNEAVPLAVSLINEYVDHLDDDYLNERFNRNYE